MYLVVALIIIILGLLAYLDTRKPKDFPPGPRWFPYIGSALQVILARKRTGHFFEATAQMAEQYGPVVGLKIGKDPMVVVYGAEALKEFLMSNDLIGRPHDEFFTMRTFNKRRGIILVDDAFWQEQRRFLLRHLREFGFGRKSMTLLLEDEAEEMVKYLKTSIVANDSQIFSIENLFVVFILNTIWKMVCGVRYHPDDARMKSLLKLLNDLFATVNMCGGLFSHFPILKYIAPEMSGYKLMVDLHKEMYDHIRAVLEEHKDTHKPGEPRDLMDVYIDVINSSDCPESFTEEQLMAVCLDIFMAGSETTNNSLAYAINYLILYPDVQRKVYEEIDRVIGKNRRITIDDKPNLPYTECVTLEALRMFGGRVITVPHRALKDTYLHGYRIPKDVLIVGNLHGCMMKESEDFKDPEKFNPDRYLKDGKVTVPDLYVPFSIGKRRCMGETLARSNVFIFVSTMIQHFEFSVVPEHPPDQKMTDGVTPALRHFKARITPRN